ncbi:MAG: M28 family peptidase [Chitinophagaceae bacterium]|nr:MAG: M28 family peptidase [Chitinophagaceae bacterium]
MLRKWEKTGPGQWRTLEVPKPVTMLRFLLPPIFAASAAAAQQAGPPAVASPTSGRSVGRGAQPDLSAVASAKAALSAVASAKAALSAVASAKADTIPDAVVAIARSTPAAELRRLLFALAAPGMEGRRMATRGDSAAARYVATRFTELRLAPPSHRGYYQPITARRRTRAATLTLGNRRYPWGAGWNLYPRADSLQLRNAPIMWAGADSALGFLGRLQATDLQGKVVLLPGMPFRLGQFDRLDSAESILKGRGAAAVLWTDSRVAKAHRRREAFAFLPEYEARVDDQNPSTAFTEIGLLPALMAGLLQGESGLRVDSSGTISGPRAPETFPLQATLSLEVQSTYHEETAPNVLGVLRGNDPDASCIVVTAHRDHDGLNGKTLYPGAVDNASGTVALIQLADMMQQAARAGHRPRRTIVFASVTGEERGLLGSAWYTDHPAIPLAKTRAVLNIDMLGRVDTFYRNRRADSNYVYVLVEDSARIGLLEEVRSANAVFNALRLDDRYTRPPGYQRMLRGSDHYPFFLKKIPFVYFATGFSEDYHQPTDTPDRINYDLLTKQTQLAFLTLWNMANSPGR